MNHQLDKHPAVAIKLSSKTHPGPGRASCGRRPKKGSLALWTGLHQVPRKGDMVLLAQSAIPCRVSAFVVCKGYLTFICDDEDPSTTLKLVFGHEIVIQFGALPPGARVELIVENNCDAPEVDCDSPEVDPFDAAFREQAAEIFHEVAKDETRPVATTWQEFVLLASDILAATIRDRVKCGCGESHTACPDCKVIALQRSAALHLCDPARLTFEAITDLLQGGSEFYDPDTTVH